MIDALAAALLTSLLLACLVQATRPGHLLHGLAPAWEWWLIEGRPQWLPREPSGNCIQCTATWIPGLPMAICAWAYTDAGLWALTVPLLVGIITEKILRK